jgi:hypothetical protein
MLSIALLDIQVLQEETMKSWFKAGSERQDYEIGIDTNVTYNGKNSGYIKAKSAELRGFGILLAGKGKAWLSAVQFEEVGIDVPTTAPAEHKELPDGPGNLDFAE